MNEENDRKIQRRDNFKKKHLDTRDDGAIEYRDTNKLKKQFKQKKQQLRAEELWEDWENEIS